MTVDRFIIILVVLIALMVAYAMNVDAGMAEVTCGPNGLGGKICTHP